MMASTTSSKLQSIATDPGGGYVFGACLCGVLLSNTKAGPIALAFLSVALLYQVSQLLAEGKTNGSTTGPAASSGTIQPNTGDAMQPSGYSSNSIGPIGSDLSPSKIYNVAPGPLNQPQPSPTSGLT